MTTLPGRTGAVTYSYKKDQYKSLRTSPKARELVDVAARTLAKRAGPGFDLGLQSGKTRGRRIVRTATKQARARQASEHALERAIGMGRLL